MIMALPIGIIMVNLNEEGAFDTTKESFRILVAGFNKFRRLHSEDTKIVNEYEEELKDSYQKEEIDHESHRL